ncbi:unnamed protein product, partial [Ectocarpus sp. 12 AP-2014]
VFPLPRGTKDGKAVRGLGWGGGYGEKGHPLEVCTPRRFYIVPPAFAIRENGNSAAAAGAGGTPVVLVGFGSVGESRFLGGAAAPGSPLYSMDGEGGLTAV